LNYTGDPRALFELGNQKLCYEFLKHKIAAREPLTINLVLETHGVLTGGTYDERRYVERGERPGAFKKHDYVTGRAEVGSMPEDVPGDVEALLNELHELANGNTPAETILKAAAYFHLRFEYIHPFADGNGRVGRTLMNYFLMTHNHPPIIVYDEEKAAYYDALERYDQAEEIQPMVDFLVRQTELTWRETLARKQRREVIAATPDTASEGYTSVLAAVESAKEEQRTRHSSASARTPESKKLKGNNNQEL